jgi:hypothetical protein
MKRAILMIGILLALPLFWGAGAFARDLPDRTRTPGVANPDVTQDGIRGSDHGFVGRLARTPKGEEM